jgi:hypothetical protein
VAREAQRLVAPLLPFVIEDSRFAMQNQPING